MIIRITAIIINTYTEIINSEKILGKAETIRDELRL